MAEVIYGVRRSRRIVGFWTQRDQFSVKRSLPLHKAHAMKVLAIVDFYSSSQYFLNIPEAASREFGLLFKSTDFVGSGSLTAESPLIGIFIAEGWYLENW